MTKISQQASCFLMFSAMSEVMLSMYKNTRMLKHYDPAIETKLKNLKVNFERVSKKAHQMFVEEEQLTFFHMINVFERLIEASKDGKKFHQVMSILDAWEKGNLTIIENNQQLFETAKLITKKQEKSTDVENNSI